MVYTSHVNLVPSLTALWCLTALLRLLQLSPEVGTPLIHEHTYMHTPTHMWFELPSSLLDGGSCQGDELGFEKNKIISIGTFAEIMHQI